MVRRSQLNTCHVQGRSDMPFRVGGVGSIRLKTGLGLGPAPDGPLHIPAAAIHPARGRNLAVLLELVDG